jgi:hypothetical protein
MEHGCSSRHPLSSGQHTFRGDLIMAKKAAKKAKKKAKKKTAKKSK